MSAPIAFCPQCHNEVAFIEAANFRRCPVCGVQYESGQAGGSEGSPSTRAVSGLWIFLRFVLIMAAIIMVVLGVLFVGCVVAIRGH